MRSFSFYIMIFVVFPGLLVGAESASSQRGLSGAVDDETPFELRKSSPQGDPMAEDSVRGRIRALDTRQKVAQLMLVRLEGTPAPSAQDRLFLREHPPGGVILPSLIRPASVAGYVEHIRALPTEATLGIPAFIGADMHTLAQQGRTLQNYFPPMPSLMALAAASDTSATGALATLIAGHMNTLGLNLYFGPSLVLVPSVPGTEGTIHCLGGEPAFVAETGQALIESLQNNGIITVPTGFPGGGLNRRGRAPAVLVTPRTTLHDQELLPYKAAIEAGAPMLHVGNTLTPTLDPRNIPASVSSIVLRELVREELAFDGVLLVGPYDVAEVTRVVDPTEAALHAFRSGADMILWDAPGRHVVRTIEMVAAAVQQGNMDESIIDAALERVLNLKQRYELIERPKPRPRDVERLQRAREYPQEAYAIERKSVTLVQNRDNALPLSQPRAQPVGVTGVVGVEALHGPLEKSLKRVARQDIATARHGGRIYDFEVSRLTRYSQGVQTYVVILTNDIHPDGAKDLIREAKSVGARVVVVLVGYPSRLSEYSEADAILVTYSDSNALDESMRAVADVLLGDAPMKILPSVRELRLQAGVPETFSVYDVVRAPAGRLPMTIAEPYVAGLAVPYDPTGAIRRAQWDFGDGSRSRDLVTEKQFSEPGEYTIKLTITDNQGDTIQQFFPAVVE